jgi:predicted nucleic acid-binding protein
LGLVADTGAILALYDRRDRSHAAVRACVEGEAESIVIPVAILAEIDYLLRAHLGQPAEFDFLDSLASGAFHLEQLLAADLARANALVRQYAGLDLGLSDAVIVATAERLASDRILTLDERDFRAVRSASGKPFVLLPADRR